MSQTEADDWNTRYLSDPLRRQPGKPHALLAGHLDLLPSTGLAVDMACGLCSSGLFLASRGWRVIGLDAAGSALRIARTKACERGLDASFAVMDLADPWLPETNFDAVLNFYYLSRPLFDLYRRILKPGGMLFFETFVWMPGIQLRPEHYLQPGELLRAFTGWDILFFEEGNRVHQELQVPRRVDRLIARKPV